MPSLNRSRIAGGIALATAQLLLVAAAPPASQTPPINLEQVKAAPSAEDFAAPPIWSSARLSPSGDKLAVVTMFDGDPIVYVVTPDDPYKPELRVPLPGYGLTNVTWAGDKRLLLQVLTRGQIYGVVLPITRLMVVDIAAKSAQMVDDESNGVLAGDVLRVDPAGDWAIVTGQDGVFEYPSVKKVDLSTGKAERIQKEKDGVWDWFADPNGEVRAGIAQVGRRWTLWYRDPGSDKMRKVGGKVERDDLEVIDSILLPPSRTGAAVISNWENGRFAVYSFDLETGEEGDLIFANPNGDVDDMILNPADGTLAGVRYHDRRWKTYWLDPQLASVQNKLDELLFGNDNRILDRSRDGTTVLVHSSRANDPGCYYLFNVQAGKLQKVMEPYSRVADRDLSPVEAVDYRARDGVNIPAFLTLPKDREAKDLPLIVFPHGGPFARDTWDYDPWVQFFASRGYAVLQPQFRGSTGFGRDFVELGYGQWGRAMQDDLDDGVDWLVAQGKIDPKRVCMVGGSYGGYAAMWAAARNPDRYRCAISWAGVSDLSAMLKSDKDLFAAKRYYRSWRDRVAGIETDKKELANYSPMSFPAKISIPLLLGHGEKDDNVPVSQSKDMEAALKASGANVESVYYPKAGHSIGRIEDMADWLKRMEAFLAKHNPA